MIMLPLSEIEVISLMIFQIWWVIGFISHMFSGEEPNIGIGKALFHMSLGPLNVIRLLIRKHK